MWHKDLSVSYSGKQTSFLGLCVFFFFFDKWAFKEQENISFSFLSSQLMADILIMKNQNCINNECNWLIPFKVTHTQKNPTKKQLLSLKLNGAARKSPTMQTNTPWTNPTCFYMLAFVLIYRKMLHFLNQFPCSPPVCWTRKEACFVLTCIAQFVRVWPDRETIIWVLLQKWSHVFVRGIED